MKAVRPHHDRSFEVKNSLVALPPQAPASTSKQAFYSQKELNDGCLLLPLVPHLKIFVRELRYAEFLKENILELLGVNTLQKKMIYCFTTFTIEGAAINQSQSFPDEVRGCQNFIGVT